ATCTQHKHLIRCSLRKETFAQSITPLENKALKSEGEKVTLSCKYDGAVNNLHWYRQHLGSKPEFIAYIYPHGATSNPLPDRIIPKVDKNNNLNLRVPDSAVYYCALQPTVTETHSKTYKINKKLQLCQCNTINQVKTL
uniref:Ig-like domain-containing protein n=1 Tax=Sinocyclocheilus grahami TaxID=75366 RepID=A0A672PCM4_SINGR